MSNLGYTTLLFKQVLEPKNLLNKNFLFSMIRICKINDSLNGLTRIWLVVLSTEERGTLVFAFLHSCQNDVITPRLDIAPSPINTRYLYSSL